MRFRNRTLLGFILVTLVAHSKSQAPDVSVNVEKCVNRWRQLKPHLAERFTPKQIAWFCLRTGINPPKPSSATVGISGSKPRPETIDLDSLLHSKTKGTDRFQKGGNNEVEHVKINVEEILDFDPDLRCVEELIRKNPSILKAVTREQLRWQCQLSRGQVNVMSRDAMKRVNSPSRRGSFAKGLSCRGADCLKQIYNRSGASLSPPKRKGNPRDPRRLRNFRRRKHRRPRRKFRRRSKAQRKTEKVIIR